MRKQNSKIEFPNEIININSKEVSTKNYNGDVINSGKNGSINSGIEKHYTKSAASSINPAIVLEVVNGVISICNNLVTLGCKIQETEQMREKTKQVKAETAAKIRSEIEATKRMLIEMEMNKDKLAAELKHHRMDIEARLIEGGREYEKQLKAMDFDMEKFKDKLYIYSKFFDKLLAEYDELETVSYLESSIKSEIQDAKKQLREDIIKVLELSLQV